MMLMKVGTLVSSLVNFDLIDGTKVSEGDIGIILENELAASEHFFTDFDYKIVINSREIYVFKDEIEPYT